MEKQRNKKGSLPIGVRIIGIIIAVLAAAYGLYAVSTISGSVRFKAAVPVEVSAP